MSTLLITIDRTSLGLSPLVLSGTNDSNPIGVTDYTEPAMQSQVHYAPDGYAEDGSIPLSSRLQDTIVGFAVSTTDAATETESRALISELRAALRQFSYAVTIQVADAPAETWTCDSGSVIPVGGRNFADLANHNPEWSVTIPARPVPVIT